MTPRRAANGTAYDLAGPTGAPVIALVHGLGLNRGTWQWHEPALAERFRILNYDLFGHGESASPPETASLTLFARQLRELMDELDIARCAIAGFSLGGMINRRFAIDYPDRLAAMAILNSPHERGKDAQRLVEERATKTQAGGAAATLDETLRRWFTPQYLAAQPDTIEMIRQWVLANDPDDYTACRWVLANGVIELIRPDPPIVHPTLVITCENDSGSTPAMSHAIASEIAGAETIIVPHLQHMGLVERPDLFTEPMIEFFSRTLT